MTSDACLAAHFSLGIAVSGWLRIDYIDMLWPPPAAKMIDCDEQLMKIVVCPLSKIEQMIAVHAPERVVSLLDPDFEFPELGSAYRDRHLRLHLHDVHDCAPGQVGPAPKHVDQLLAFVGRWERSAPLLIHCRAGIGRSTAAAFIAACVHNPNVSERTIALALRRASSLARPNQVLIELADAAMGRNGRMTQAIEETGRDLRWECVDENLPFELAGAFSSESHSLMEMYEQGLITRAEIVNKLMNLAATVHPEDYIPQLPPDLRQAIKDHHYVQSPPNSWQQMFSIEAVCYKPGIDQAAAAAQKGQQDLDALRALNEYFAEK